MKVKVRYFASLRELIGRAEEDLQVEENTTIKAVWQSLNPEFPDLDKVLCALNQDYADWDSIVNDGDEIAFFPPVTGGAG